MLRQTIIAAALLCGCAAASASGYDYGPGTGALSYTFFNLSPYPWTITPYQAGPNPYASNPTTACGWQGCEDPNTPKTTNPPNFFNYWPFDTPAGGNCNNTSGKQFPWVTGNYIFYNQMADPLPYSSPGSKQVASGTRFNYVETAGATSNLANAPAIGDSWYLAPTPPDSGSGIVFAGLAAAPNMFFSGPSVGNQNYPDCVALQGMYPNYAINPVAPLDYSGTKTTETGDYGWTVYNNYGAGFVGAGQALNYNSAGNTQTGGMWAGLNNPNPGNLAVNALNMAMPALNLSNYVAATDFAAGAATYATSIYGAHYTLAVGDPFLVSSFAAKILWYIVTSNSYGFSNASLSPTDLQTLRAIVAPAGADGVFQADSIPSNYAAWLMASPGVAQSTLANLNTAASKPITKTSIWGKLLSTAFQLGVQIAIPEIRLGIGPNGERKAGVFAAEGTARFLDGAFGPSIVNSIENPFTKTLSPPAPQSQNAPPVVNGTNSSSNLLGTLLANSIMQAETNNGLGLANPYAFALYSNYPISTDALCDSATVGIVSNLITGSCYTTGSSGQLTTSTVATGSQSPSVQSYANVLSTYPNAQSSVAINLWDAILTGAQITTVQDATLPNNGYMQLSNPGTPAFAPPTQLVDLTNGAAASVAALNTAFSSGTGLVAVTSYAFNGGGLAPGSVAAPTGTPNVELRVGTQPMAGQGIQFAAPQYYSNQYDAEKNWGYYYDGSRYLYVYGYQGGVSTSGTPVWTSYGYQAGLAPLDMTTCEEGSDVYIGLDADPTSTTPQHASGTLYCGLVVPVTASQPAPASQPSLVTLVASYAGAGTLIYPPTTSEMASANLVSYDAATGTLSVAGYGYTNTGTGAGSPVAVPFVNGGPQGSISIATTDCAPGSAVTLTIYPIGTDGEQAYGYLTCQSPPSLPYGACSNDAFATGGVIVAITGAPDAQGNGATFKLACACVPQYLGGSSSNKLLGGVAVGATSDNPTQRCAQ